MHRLWGAAALVAASCLPGAAAPLDVTFIEWDAADALPFALCVSITARPGLEVSVALGWDHEQRDGHPLTQVVLGDEALSRLPARGCVPIAPQHIDELAFTRLHALLDQERPVHVHREPMTRFV